MKPSTHGACKHLRLLLLAALIASCGTGSGGGRIIGSEVVGGALIPSGPAYNVAIAADVAQADVTEDELPSFVDLRRDGVVPPIQNQTWNACVGWTFGYFLMTGLEARHYRSQGYALDINDPENWFSPDYLYSQRESTAGELEAFCHLDAAPLCQEIDGTIGCMRPERAIEGLMTDGCCRWPCLCATDDPTYRTCDEGNAIRAAQTSTTPWHLAQPCGFFFRPRCFVRFGTLQDPERPDIEQDTVRQLQSWLATQGTPVAAVVRMKENWLAYRGENRAQVPVLFRGRPGELREERGVCLDAGGRDLGSQHMMTIIGYDRNFPNKQLYPDMRDDQRGSFLIANQWGEKWGDKGTMWLPVSELQKIWVGGYGLIKWDWQTGTIPTNPVVCVQDTNGQFVGLSADGDDVPRNLTQDPTSCEWTIDEDNPTAQRLVPIPTSPATFEPVELQGDPLRMQEVGGTTNGVTDTADWFYLDVSEGNTRVDVLFQQGGLSRVRDVRITDDRFRDFTEIDPTNGEARAFVCDAGRYFIKVQPAPLDGLVRYRMSVELTPGQTRCTEPTTKEAPPPLRTHTFATQTLLKNQPDGRRYHWFDASQASQDEDWGRGIRVKVEVSGLAPGAQLELVVGGIQAPRHRALDVLTVDENGATLLVFDETTVLSSPDLPKILAVARSLTPGVDVSYSMTVSILPAFGSAARAGSGADPMTAVGPTRPAQAGSMVNWGWLDTEPSAEPAPTVLLMQEEWGFWVQGTGWRDHVLELRHASVAPTIELTGRNGAALPADIRLIDVVSSERTMGAPGVTYKRLVVPADFRAEIMGVVRDAQGQPLRAYSLRTLLQPSLSTWPFVEGSDNRTDGVWDGNNGPTRPVSLAIDQPYTDTIGFFDGTNGASWDLFDYYLVENPGDTRTVFVSLEKDPDDPSLTVRWWEPGGAVEFHDIGADRTHQDFRMKLERGERKLLLVYSGHQRETTYTLKVCSEDPTPFYGNPLDPQLFLFRESSSPPIDRVEARLAGSGSAKSRIEGSSHASGAYAVLHIHIEPGVYDFDVFVTGESTPRSYPNQVVAEEDVVIFVDPP